MEAIKSIAAKHTQVVSENESKDIDFIGLDNVREEWKKGASRLRSYRVIIPGTIMSESQFMRYIESLGALSMVEQGDRSKFIFDSENIPIVKELYKYVTYDQSCAWNLDKGILLMGKLGSGKSVLMKTFISILQRFANSDLGQSMQTKIFKFDTAQNIFNSILVENGKIPLKYINTGLCIDKLGREPKRTIVFGNETTPIVDLLLERYSKGLPTFGTSNFDLEYLSKPEFYGPVVGDRLRAMLNFVLMPGSSRRK